MDERLTELREKLAAEEEKAKQMAKAKAKLEAAIGELESSVSQEKAVLFFGFNYSFELQHFEVF